MTAVLPHDTYGRDWGLLIDQKLPAVLGSNVAGVIEEVGAGVSFKIGERVFGICYPYPTSSDQGGLQEYSILNADAIGRVSKGFSDEQVVTLPINLVTSWAALFTKTGFNIPSPLIQQNDFNNANTSVVIIGGGTNVGQLAVQLASIANVGKIIVIASASNTDRLKSMGATHVLDRHNSPTNIAQQLRAIVGQDGVTQVYTCAPLPVDLLVAALPVDKPSRLRALLPIEPDEAAKLSAQRPLCDAAFIDDLTNDSMAPHAEQFWTQVPQWLIEGKILPTEYRVFRGLEKVQEINDALDAYRDFARAAPQTVIKIEG